MYSDHKCIKSIYKNIYNIKKKINGKKKINMNRNYSKQYSNFQSWSSPIIFSRQELDRVRVFPNSDRAAFSPGNMRYEFQFL